MKDIQFYSIDEVKPYPNNPRINDAAVDKVAASLKEFGFRQPIVVDKDMVIIAGHTRLKAAKKLGLKEVPVLVADDLTEEQVKAYRLADNKTAEFAEWDDDLLAIELGGITDIDMSDFGFDLDLPEEPHEIVEDEVPEEAAPISSPGDLWLLGRHRLIVGDSTVAETIKKLTNGAKMDLYLTDPPYNVNYEGTAGKIQNDNMNDVQFKEFLTAAFSAANEVMRPGAVFYIWHADSEGYNFRTACKEAGWRVRECLIWNKDSLVLGRSDYHWKHEPCLYGWKDGAAHLWCNDRKQTTVLDFEKPKKSELHPTMKPVALFAYQIGNNTHAGDFVLDSFGGSGTSIIACEQMDRSCFACELDPKYADVIIQRYINLVGNYDAVFVERNGEKLAYGDVSHEENNNES